MDRTITEIVPLETLDVDGALREAADELPGSTRGELLRRAGLAGGGLLMGGALLGALPELAAAAKPLPKSDIAILNFAYTLELLEAAFYKEAVKNNALSGITADFATLVSEHETTHVKTLKKVLGSHAIKSPKFDFGQTTSDQLMFQATSFALENTGVHAYLGQAGKIKTPAILAAAASIVTIEARHASAIGLIMNPLSVKGKHGITPSGAFDTPLSKAKILKIVAKTHFIKK